jgi:hypothetical protein
MPWRCPVGAEWGNRRDDHDQSRIHHQPRHFADTPDVFLACRVTHAQVIAQTGAQIIAVEHKGMPPLLVELHFQRWPGSTCQTRTARQPNAAGLLLLSAARAATDNDKAKGRMDAEPMPSD